MRTFFFLTILTLTSIACSDNRNPGNPKEAESASNQGQHADCDESLEKLVRGSNYLTKVALPTESDSWISADNILDNGDLLIQVAHWNNPETDSKARAVVPEAWLQLSPNTRKLWLQDIVADTLLALKFDTTEAGAFIDHCYPELVKRLRQD
jgi:hypothetical protein